MIIMADSISKYIEVCPCCLSRELKGFMEPYEINSSAYTSKSKSIVTFYHHPLFCSNCGHVFNATPPDKKHLSGITKISIYISLRTLMLIKGFRGLIGGETPLDLIPF